MSQGPETALGRRKNALGLCDLCHRRPATMQVMVSEKDGRRRTLNVCTLDYQRLRAPLATPFEALF
jgi:hypothetical protein